MSITEAVLVTCSLACLACLLVIGGRLGQVLQRQDEALRKQDEGLEILRSLRAAQEIEQRKQAADERPAREMRH